MTIIPFSDSSHKTRIPQISETADNLAYSYYFTINMV